MTVLTRLYHKRATKPCLPIFFFFLMTGRPPIPPLFPSPPLSRSEPPPAGQLPPSTWAAGVAPTVESRIAHWPGGKEKSPSTTGLKAPPFGTQAEPPSDWKIT